MKRSSRATRTRTDPHGELEPPLVLVLDQMVQFSRKQVELEPEPPSGLSWSEPEYDLEEKQWTGSEPDTGTGFRTESDWI